MTLDLTVADPQLHHRIQVAHGEMVLPTTRNFGRIWEFPPSNGGTPTLQTLTFEIADTLDLDVGAGALANLSR